MAESDQSVTIGEAKYFTLLQLLSYFFQIAR